MARAQAVGPGVRAGNLDRFPTCLINLNELPVDITTWPLVMVGRGPAEHRLVQYFLTHRSELSHYWRQLTELHWQSLLEVIMMEGITFEDLGVKDAEEFVAGLVRLAGSEEKLVRLLGEERLVRALGEERIVQALGEERLLRDLIQRLGAKRVRQLVEQLAEETSSLPESGEQ